MDIIIIAWEKELPVMEIQARSLDLYFQVPVDRILIINNYANDRSAVHLARRDGKLNYGRLDDRVEIIDRDDLPGYSPPLNIQRVKIPRNTMEQMRCKLLAARCATADDLMYLDAKTFFVSETLPESVYLDGRLRGLIYPPWEYDFWVTSYYDALKEFDVYNEYTKKRQLLNQTPFFVQTHLVTGMMDAISAKHGDFSDWFDRTGNMAEFHLIQGYAIQQGEALETYFWSNRRQIQRQLWKQELSEIKEDIVKHMDRFSCQESDFLAKGLHRDVWCRLNARQAVDIAVWLHELKLVSSLPNAASIIREMQVLNPFFYEDPSSLPKFVMQ